MEKISHTESEDHCYSPHAFRQWIAVTAVNESRNTSRQKTKKHYSLHPFFCKNTLICVLERTIFSFLRSCQPPAQSGTKPLACSRSTLLARNQASQCRPFFSSAWMVTIRPFLSSSSWRPSLNVCSRHSGETQPSYACRWRSDVCDSLRASPLSPPNNGKQSAAAFEPMSQNEPSGSGKFPACVIFMSFAMRPKLMPDAPGLNGSPGDVPNHLPHRQTSRRRG